MIQGSGKINGRPVSSLMTSGLCLSKIKLSWPQDHGLSLLSSTGQLQVHCCGWIVVEVFHQWVKVVKTMPEKILAATATLTNHLAVWKMVLRLCISRTIYIYVKMNILKSSYQSTVFHGFIFMYGSTYIDIYSCTFVNMIK